MTNQEIGNNQVGKIAEMLLNVTNKEQRARIVERELYFKFPDIMNEINESERLFEKDCMNIYREQNIQIRQSIREFANEIQDKSPEFYKNARVRFIKQEIENIENVIRQIEDDFEESRKHNIPYWLRKCFYDMKNIQQYTKKLESFQLELKRLIYGTQISKERIDDFMIERAMQYPIENLLEINKRGFASCPFHDDNHNPNFYTKKNFGYCFSCGKSANVIDLYMILHNADFVSAVKALQ